VRPQVPYPITNRLRNNHHDEITSHVSVRQDNDLTDEARERAERNWSVMLAGLKHFVEHNRPTIDIEPD
jgi:hypothetical protein